MNWLDILILVILSGVGLIGLRIGIIRAVFTVAGIVLGIALAGQFGDRLGEELDFVSNPNGAKVLGFAIVFILVFVAASAGSNVLQRFISILFLGWVDKAGGAALGVGAGSLIVMGGIVAAGSSPFGGLDGAIEESRMATFLVDNTPFVLSIVPEEYQDVLAYAANDLKRPQATLSAITITRTSDSNVTINIEVHVENPNPFGGTIERVTAQLFWESQEGVRHVADVMQDKKLRLKVKSTPLIVAVELEEGQGGDLAKLTEYIVQEKHVPFTVKDGSVTIAFRQETLIVPFQGTIAAQQPR